MARENSFDVVSEVDMAEVKNAVHQAVKEVNQRYDLKKIGSTIELIENERRIVIASVDEFNLKTVLGVLQQKLARRGVSLKALTYGTVTPSAKATVRQVIDLQHGIPIEQAREIAKLVKQMKLKVQASINDDMVRVSGKDRDSLQRVIEALKEQDLGIDMQFTNYRSR